MIKRATRSQAKRLGDGALTIANAGWEAMGTALRSALTRTIRVAITGLSRAGKTVFTTNLIHSLLLAPARPHLLSFLEAVANGKLKDARIHSIEGMKKFPYEENLERLTRPAPEWPQATEELAGVRIEIRYRPANEAVARAIGWATLNIEIVDYPGEWLLDLPLLQMGFAEWSHGVLDLCAAGTRRKLAAPWLARMSEIDPDRPYGRASDLASDILSVSRAYHAFLQECRKEENGLKLLQPGRFLTGFEGSDAPPEKFLFSPLPTDGLAAAKSRKRPSPDTLRGQMERRFERYKREIVVPFYRRSFRHFHRQLVLVDVLTALNTGFESFYDTREALLRVMESFKFGRGSLLGSLFSGQWGRRIDRVFFAATKADHVTRTNHANLERLLEAMVGRKAEEIRSEGAQAGFGSVAAVNTTKNVLIDHEGAPLAVLEGILMNGPRVKRTYYPGDIPADLPTADYWLNNRFKVLAFAPPDLSKAAEEGIPPVRLGDALQFLIGDKLP